MSARLSFSIALFWILGCASPAVGTPEAPSDGEPADAALPVTVASTPGSRAGSQVDPVASEDPDDVDTGDGVAEAPEGPSGRPPAHKNVQSTPSPAPPDAPPAAGAPKLKPICPKPAGINQVNDRSWTVTRALVDKWQANPYSLGNVKEDGEGWQLVAVRVHPDYHLGMRNGDIVLEVNGHKLNTMPNMLAAYLSCKNDSKFDVVFLRSGTRMTHHYEIVN